MHPEQEQELDWRQYNHSCGLRIFLVTCFSTVAYCYFHPDTILIPKPLYKPIPIRYQKALKRKKYVYCVCLDVRPLDFRSADRKMFV